jgi:hypothetical protein
VRHGTVTLGSRAGRALASELAKKIVDICLLLHDYIKCLFFVVGDGAFEQKLPLRRKRESLRNAYAHDEVKAGHVLCIRHAVQP